MKRLLALLLILGICLSLCGCDMWMDGSYYSVRPHREAGNQESDGAAEVSTFDQLCQALQDMVSDGLQEGVLYANGIEAEQLKTYMTIANSIVVDQYPIGAYAVDSISYELGTNAGRIAVAVQITYNHTRSEILRIKRAEDMSQCRAIIMEALRDFEPSAVIMVDGYEQMDVVQLVQDYVDTNPDVCVEMPQVSFAVYPDAGSQRVIEVTFSYQSSRENLRMMQDYVQTVFRAANVNVSAEEEETTKFARMYAFLMERTDYRVETSVTQSYSLLRHGVGDSKSFAVVYAAMCRGAGLECRVVTGTRDGEPWVWNLICTDGVYYYVDLLSSKNAGKLQRLTEDDMGDYVWDYTDYPKAGPVYAADPAPETVQPTEPAAPEVTEPTLPEVTEPENTQPAPTEPAVPPTQPTEPAPETEPEEVLPAEPYEGT